MHANVSRVVDARLARRAVSRMAGKSGTASSNILDVLPFEKWGEKLAKSTIAQAKAEQGWVRDGGAARGSVNNSGVIGGDAKTIRENARRIEVEDHEDENAGLLAAELGRPTPGRSSGRQIDFDTHPATATYGREEFEITKAQIGALVAGIVILLVVARLAWLWAWF
jgi:hypothetical protein